MAAGGSGQTVTMSGSLFFIGIVLVIGLVMAVLITPILLIPVFLIIVAALFAAPIVVLFGRISGSRSRSGQEAGTPTTSQASYDPVSRPDGLAPRG